MDLAINFFIYTIFFFLGLFIGSSVEKRHYKSILEREEKFLYLPVVVGEDFLEDATKIKSVELVSGSAVISIDYFKFTLALLRNILGGEVRSYETLLDRARREAILRLKEKAKDADIVLNLRIETSCISMNSVEVLAYATAVYFEK